MKRLNIGALIGLLCIAGIKMYAEDSPVTGAVLSPRQSVEATNKNGTIKISYMTPIKRKYEWDGKTRVVKMIRRSEPFQGRLGLYNPADSWGLNPFEIRIVVEEAVRDFDNEDQIYAFLRQSSQIMDWVYTSDGLVIGFGRTPARNQINVDLWQILLHGKKPSGLKEANPNAIRLISMPPGPVFKKIQH